MEKKVEINNGDEDMRIVTLMENTPGREDVLFEHGLSIYIETNDKKILVDTGATDGFMANAKTLGVDLQEVDMLVLSHGHYDHSGGILTFAKENITAEIWMQRLAGEAYYHKNEEMEKYIGIDIGILDLPQVKLLDGDFKIQEGISVFSGVKGRRLWPSGNLELMVKKEDGFEQDSFQHEQYLVLEEEGKQILISGCAHNGILNILEKYREIYSQEPDIVISGFHMQKKSGYSEADLEMVKEISLELKKTKTKFYTGHCTGEIPFKILKQHMGSQVEYLHSGDEIIC